MLRIGCIKEKCLKNTAISVPMSTKYDYPRMSITLDEIMIAQVEDPPKQSMQTVNLVLVIVALLPLLSVTFKLYLLERKRERKMTQGGNAAVSRESYFAMRDDKAFKAPPRESWVDEVEETSRFSYARDDTYSSYNSTHRPLANF